MSRPTAMPAIPSASCCADGAIVEYWLGDAIGRQTQIAPVVEDSTAPRGSMGTKACAHGGRPMSFYRGMTCENVTIKGDKGTPITAYVAKPSGAGPFPGVVLIHHLPGWSELYIETTRRFAHHGYMAICANLYEREGGHDANPDD